MQKFKFKQKKNMKLREYLRKTKEHIINNREESEDEVDHQGVHDINLDNETFDVGTTEGIKAAMKA